MLKEILQIVEAKKVVVNIPPDFKFPRPIKSALMKIARERGVSEVDVDKYGSNGDAQAYFNKIEILFDNNFTRAVIGRYNYTDYPAEIEIRLLKEVKRLKIIYFEGRIMKGNGL